MVYEFPVFEAMSREPHHIPRGKQDVEDFGHTILTLYNSNAYGRVCGALPVEMY